MNVPFKGIIFEVFPFFHWQQPLSNGKMDPCADMELNHAECLEAYGLAMGRNKCAKFFEDIKECRGQKIRLMRAYIMRIERNKQLVTGERKWADRWAKPYDYDSFVYGSFMP